MSPNLELVVGVLLGFASPFVFIFLFRRVTIQVEDEEAAVVTHFGKLVATLTKPGLHSYLSRILPWVRVQHVSLKRDFRHIERVPVNDARGTTLLVDLWVEFRIVDPVRSLFSVADWDRSLHNLVSHAATSILGDREFSEILSDRTELSQRLGSDIAAETGRWGVAIEFVFIRNVSLLPEVSRLIFESIAARLRRAKANLDELGRIQIAKLEAATEVQVTTLVAEAKGQYPAAIGLALARLKETPDVFAAYTELHELSLLRPHRTIAFRGFARGELKAADAAMMTTPTGEPSPSEIAELSSSGETRLRGRTVT